MAIFSNKKGIRKRKGTADPKRGLRVPIPGLKWAPPKRGEGPPPYVPEGKRPVPKRKIPKSRLGGKLKRRLRKLLRNRRKTARKGKPGRGKLRRRGKPGQRSEGIGHAAIIDGKNWDGTRNNPRANARRERQRQRAARKPGKKPTRSTQAGTKAEQRRNSGPAFEARKRRAIRKGVSMHTGRPGHYGNK
jgi:hypothetical protein